MLLPVALLRMTRPRMHRQVKGPSGFKFLGGPSFVLQIDKSLSRRGTDRGFELLAGLTRFADMNLTCVACDNDDETNSNFD